MPSPQRKLVKAYIVMRAENLEKIFKKFFVCMPLAGLDGETRAETLDRTSSKHGYITAYDVSFMLLKC